MKRGLTIFLLIGIILGCTGYVAYSLYVRTPLRHLLFPCQTPITYSIGSFDTRFGVSKSAFSAAIAKATTLWELPIKKDLFAPADAGELTVNLIYDARQEVTQKLGTLGITLHADQESYNEMRAKYLSLQATYTQNKSALQAMEDEYAKKKVAYESAVQYWNSRGGAPQHEYDTLTAERTALNAEADQINTAQAELNAVVDNINTLVTAMNDLAKKLNLNVETYNTIGASQGQEFEEGVYISNNATQEIDIYQFDNQDKLVRVLAHELGHALGLPHLDNPQAIMYRLNEGVNEKLTADDLAALRAKCGIH